MCLVIHEQLAPAPVAYARSQIQEPLLAMVGGLARFFRDLLVTWNDRLIISL